MLTSVSIKYLDRLCVQGVILEPTPTKCWFGETVWSLAGKDKDGVYCFDFLIFLAMFSWLIFRFWDVNSHFFGYECAPVIKRVCQWIFYQILKCPVLSMVIGTPIVFVSHFWFSLFPLRPMNLCVCQWSTLTFFIVLFFIRMVHNWRWPAILVSYD